MPEVAVDTRVRLASATPRGGALVGRGGTAYPVRWRRADDDPMDVPDTARDVEREHGLSPADKPTLRSRNRQCVVTSQNVCHPPSGPALAVACSSSIEGTACHRSTD